MRISLALGFALVLSFPVDAQVVVSGTVTDAATGEVLPAATVQVEGTTTGTITNRAGAFEINVRAAPGELLVRFIGYESARVAVPAAPERQQVAVRLQPSAVQAPEVVVTGEDPAENIMRRVIEEKARWQSRLATWSADAYARQTIARDTGVVAILEGATTAYWRRGDGIREVVRGARQTANVDFFDPEFVRAAEAVINLYDDEVPFAGFRLPGPTAPNALRFYRFTLDSIRTQDDRLVYDILMTPRSGLQPGFEGRVSVQSEEWVIIDAAVRPNEVVRFPGVQRVEIDLAQQFIGLPVGDGSVWLPADYRFSGRVQIGIPGLRFPEIDFRSVVRLTDYEVNGPVPDSLFVGPRRAVVDRASVEADTALDRSGLIVPLEPREAAAYARIDTTDTVAEAFQPTGPLARLVRIQMSAGRGEARADRERTVRFSPVGRFNRVEAAHIGASVRVQGPVGTAVHARGGYATGLEAVTYAGTVSFTSGARGPAPFGAIGYFREHVPTGAPAVYPEIVTSVATLFGGPDYYDYYRRQGISGEAGVRLPRQRVRVAVGARLEDHRSLPVSTAYDLLGRREVSRLNPPVDEGRLHAASVALTWGEDPIPFGGRLLPGPGAALHLEAAESSLLGGDFNYLRADLTLQHRLETGLRRRLQPMALTLRLSGGASTGDLPAQRTFTVEGTALALAPAGALRTVRGVRVGGRQYAAATWEHDFRTVPFEILGLSRLADLGFTVQVLGGHARTWDTPASTLALPAWRHELGIGFSGGLTVPVRLDITARLDAPGIFVSIGLPRLR